MRAILTRVRFDLGPARQDLQSAFGQEMTAQGRSHRKRSRQAGAVDPQRRGSWRFALQRRNTT